ncbi:MAG: aminotransferase class I/II-fold pyridoxal phosphate-dependent enzyme [Oscillospiraceae bacterium]|nr:aminotransferase class I/II-fold pyridoxal phosphate-dependent enzyme [Oscillospiraceae bacterium]
MKPLKDFTPAQKEALKTETQKRYDNFSAEKLNIDMSRGKPGPDQLDLSEKLLTAVSGANDYKSENGFDCRNYGLLTGIPECIRLFAELFEAPENNVIIGGNSSLELMFDYISQCVTNGAGGKPWGQLPEVKFIAVTPGYDRHFAIAEYFGIKMINVPILSGGPDMDMVEGLIKDESVKGMFCVPKYSNPDGISYSDETVKRLAEMRPAASDFRVIWDNAYMVHGLYENDDDKLLNVFDEAKKHGNEDIFVMFASTSKITFPGAGVSALAASDANIKMITKRMTMQIISYDKLNQLRFTKVFKTSDDIKAHMRLHAEILRPKFAAVLETLEKELGGLGIASWNVPKGGYFISLNVETGSAKKVGDLCKKAGLILTNVGATFPYGIDENDANIRIAPTFPSPAELKKAAELLCVAVKLVCLS